MCCPRMLVRIARAPRSIRLSGLTTTARTNMTVPVPSNLLLSFERWEYCRRYMRIHIEIAYRTVKMPKRMDSRNKATS